MSINSYYMRLRIQAGYYTYTCIRQWCYLPGSAMMHSCTATVGVPLTPTLPQPTEPLLNCHTTSYHTISFPRSGRPGEFRMYKLDTMIQDLEAATRNKTEENSTEHQNKLLLGRSSSHLHSRKSAFTHEKINSTFVRVPP